MGKSERSLSPSLEDYLEAILRIIQEKQAVRAKDISMALSVSKSSVTGALRALSERGMVNYAPYDVITLTEAGRAAAGEVARKRELLRNFFINVLGSEETLAGEAACGMEHALPLEILERFMDYTAFMRAHLSEGLEWAPSEGYRRRGAVASIMLPGGEFF